MITINMKEEKLFTIKDIIDAWDASDDYREQIERINNGYSNFTKSTYLDKGEYLRKLINNL